VVRQQTRTLDQILAAIAGNAHGVVTRGDLLEAGLTPGQIRHRLRLGSLIRIHPGVYRVGHAAPSTETLYAAAVKACGPGSFLSGPASAFHLYLFKAKPPRPEVTTPTERNVAGARITRSRVIHPHDFITHRNIPTASVSRLLVEMAGRWDEAALALLCHEAHGRYRTTPAQVEAALARHPTSPGAAKLRRVMAGGAPISLSRLESRFLERLRESGLPLPAETNRPAGSFHVDCRWPEHRLTVELDSYRFHNSRHSWQRDRLREREAFARGDQHRRYTWEDVNDDPRLMLRELVGLLLS